MSISKALLERLSALAKQGSDAAQALRDDQGRAVVTVQSGTAHVSATLVDYDRYSGMLDNLQVGAGGAPTDAQAFLSAKAAAIAQRLSFLEEPLAVWELDGGQRAAQLRSSPPLREGTDVTYWEVELAAGDAPNARLTRYHWAPGMPEREQVIYPATFALLGRLADSLAAALTEAE